ncbi:hypothetical protein ABT009_04465 [Streptomyces sp. NPDC002896]|uniref:FAD binding domain-containing protein n=1 Tax=Streptomyces sp. NPDC002896 TaxID=3154438 RepID=UPI0033314B50
MENVLTHGELITHVDVPLPSAGLRARYVKIRDRASYEFALVSAVAALRIEEGAIREARLALGGVGTVPWRARAVEDLLRGRQADEENFRAAAEVPLRDPYTVPGTEFKVELARRVIVHALRNVSGAQA